MKPKKKLSHYFAWMLNYLVLLFTISVSIVPILWVVLSSFKSNKAILNNPFTLPTSINFDAYFQVLRTTDFMGYIINSFLISFSATFLAVFIYSFSAYAFAKFEFRGKTTLFTLFAITLLIPAYAIAQPIFTLVNITGLYDTRTALVFVYTSTGMAISLFILRAAFMSIPKELDEAAYIDSANFWQVFLYINLPLAKSGLATAFVLQFLGNYNEFFYGLMLTASAESRTLPVALKFFNEQFSYNYTQLFAALTMVTLPGIIVYLLAQEQVQRSIVGSGIKG